mmetsp:Transcript_36217/g.116173  ORF Transcript_36217/g.116173 Transcript_36217/m.116173 type:complete len:136 (-) Transcript_36217:336-743(-)
MARFPPRVTQQILVMAESRNDVVRRALGVSDMVDYHLELSCLKLRTGEWYWGVNHPKLVICGDAGLEIREASTLGLGVWVTEPTVINVFAACGYMVDEIKPQMARMVAGYPLAQKRVVRVLRIPRRFALEHVLVL